MQQYRWPGYEMKLLGELQRQQHKAQYCDTLLQTEGIAVPAHSCILAALSPYLSQRLSASPSGQERRLRLQAVKDQTLLKLVGLMYSGKLEVKGSMEQNEVLSAARQLGITDLVEGQKDGGEGEAQKKTCWSSRGKNDSRTMQDAQVQTEMAERREPDSPVEKRCVSTGTQTVTAGDETMDSCFTHSCQTKHPTPEPASSGAQSLDFSISVQGVTFDKHSCSTPCPPVFSVHRGARSDGESTLERSSDVVSNPTSASALSSIMATSPHPLNDDSNHPTSQEDSAIQQSSQSGGSKEGTGVEDGKTNETADSRENTEQPRHTSNRGVTPGGEAGNSTVKRSAHVGVKNLDKMKQMKQMMETTQISVKVKLRRRTKGAVWEVVRIQNPDDTLSVLTSLTQDDSNHKRPHTDLTESECPPSSVQPDPAHKPQTQILQPAATIPTESPPQPNITTSDSQVLSSDCLTSNQNDNIDPVLLPQPPGAVEECDEQIEKMLEDIMIGLNILPNLERDYKKPHYLQPNHDSAVGIYQVPVPENEQQQSRASINTAGCDVCFQDFGPQIGHSSTDTGICCGFTAQNQPSCSSLSSVEPNAVVIQQQQQPCSPQYHSSFTSMEQRVGMSHEGMPLSKDQTTTTSAVPIALYSSGQKLPNIQTFNRVCQETSSQDSQSTLEFLPLRDGIETQSSHSLPCMDDLRLPPCLSPLERSASATKQRPSLSESANQSDKIQPQSSLPGRPWLTLNPVPVQFPLSAITRKAKKKGRNHKSTQQQKHLEAEERGAGHQNVAELQSDSRKMENCEQSDNKDVPAPRRRKRKYPGCSQEASLAHEHVRVSDGTKGCSVSLSSNNVLAKEREMSTSSSNAANKLIPNEPSTITEIQREETREPVDLNTDLTRIRTRGFLKKSHETSSNSSVVLKPVACSAPIVQGLPKQRRGRPRKIRLEESCPGISPAMIGEKSHDVEKERQTDVNLQNEESEKRKGRIRKARKRNRSDVEEIPLKTKSAESTVSDEAGDNSDVIPEPRRLRTPKRPRMVTLKEFEKLIKRQHSKTRKSKEGQDKETSGTVQDVRSEGEAHGSRCQELTNETEVDVDVAPPQNGDGVEESHVLFNVTVDENRNQIFSKSTAEDGKSQPDNTNSSARKETSLIGESQAEICVDVSGEEESTLDAEREQPLNNLDEEACDAEPSAHSLGPQTPERTCAPPSPAAGFSRSLGCEQGEEEVEVDVLLFSPDRAPQTRGGENGSDSMDVSPEEEEEEDVNEIDVTGDEAE